MPAILLEESFRWYGPADPVTLADVRQTGATAVFTSLHQIPYGQPWPREAIGERKSAVEAAGLRWTAVESVPVHEDIKTGQGDVEALFESYRQTLRNLGAHGVNCVVYNFMPVLDWIRTDLRYRLPDGTECLRYDPGPVRRVRNLRPTTARRRGRLHARAVGPRVGVVAVAGRGRAGRVRAGDHRRLPRHEDGPDDRRRAADAGQVPPPGRGRAQGQPGAVPAGRDARAEEAGVRLAIHPDDPPFPVLGLPRILSTADDVADLLAMTDSSANGLCFCTGSFSARPDNDLPAMVRRFASRIHAVHLRSTQRLPDGSFYEADHLGGSVDVPAVVSELLAEQDRRRAAGRPDWQLPFRPDHGHTMLDDLAKPPPPNPGYSCVGRMRGLAELRGVMHGLRHRDGRGHPSVPSDDFKTHTIQASRL